MRLSPLSLCALAALGAFASSGCHSPYMAGGYGAYPTYQSQPVYTTPSPYGSGTIISPQGTTPSYQAPLQTYPGNGTQDAPLYQPPPSGSTGAGGTGVPETDYGDAGSNSPFYDANPGPSTQNDVESLSSPIGRRPTDGQSTALAAPPIEQASAIEPAPQFPTVNLAGGGIEEPRQFLPPDQANPTVAADLFAEPMPLHAASSAHGDTTGEDPSLVGFPNPYAYDRDGYRWLRGVVDYDDVSRTWMITYSLTPEADDQFGGCIELIDDEKLDILRDDDVVRIIGRVDLNTVDRRGKAMYRVEQCDQLRPRDDAAATP